ncbi:hypothetical protein AAW14_06460 [Streptomyces hygroscopicus]|uniref:hypothetical protein n=1 Tax=Streptomyces hygroscopicus TaxID=1912 RepID=UPI00223EBE61|nr:hypothetical protein [Streptomyces hygroscopicus]MCW7941681.1 hypothetical protein [Streptomyces hygroscopicus]
MTTPVVLALPPVVQIAPTGVQGPRGNGTLTGTGAPTPATGIDGDYYFDTTNYPGSLVLYGPKASGAWPVSGVTLSNAAGAPAGGDLSGTLPDPQVVATHLAAPLPISQGGTGSATQAFVDLTTDQTIAGNKTLSYYTVLQGGQVNTDFSVYGALSPAGTFGAFGAAPVGRQTVTGAKGGNTALGSVIAALAALGFITDNTT